MIYGSWDLECDRLKLVIWGHFLSFYLAKSPKYQQKFEKLEKKIAVDITILLTRTKDHNHMIYDFWDTEWDKQKIFVILGDFLLFYFTNDPEKQNFEKTLKRPNMNILHTCTLNDNHLMDGSWGMGCGGQNFLSFWTIFCFFAQLTTQKLKLKKNAYNCWRYHHFITHVQQKL